MTSHGFHILFIRSKSVFPAHIQGEELIQGHEYQEIEEIIGGHPKGCLLQISLLREFLSL